MSVTIKTAKEIELMRHAGKLLEEIHSGLESISDRELPPESWIRSGRK